MRIFYRNSIAFILSCSFFLFACVNQTSAPKKNKHAIEDEGMEKRNHMDKAMAFEIERTKDPRLGYVPKQRLFTAFEQVKKKSLTQRVAGALPSITWNERGPGNVGGRTRSILIDKNDPSGNTVWAGSVGGGLWKGTNFTTAGYQWIPANDLFTNLAVTTIAQNDVNLNTLYFGTGEGFYNVDAIQGGGIWKSINDGTTWTQLPATAVTSPSSTFSFVQKIVVKQIAGTEYVLAATRNGGVQRSTDGGTTWTQVLTSAQSMNSAADIEIAKNGDIYASLGLGLGMDGIYKSTDNGSTWIRLAVGLPPAGYARIELACAPSDENVVYASFQNIATDTCLGIWKTTTAGVAWLPVTNPSDPIDGTNWASAQAWYDMIIAVDPDDPNRVIIGGLDSYITANGGTNWTKMSSWYGGAPQYIHADHHEIKFFKSGANKYLYFGNDGGVFFSGNASAAIPPVVTRDVGYNVTQFYHGSIGPMPGSNQLLAGAQDNGTQYFTQAGINATTEVTGGDGAFSHIDDDNPNIQVSQYVYNYYFITNNNWASYTSIEIGGSQGRFINPTDYDSRTNTLYGAYSSNNYTIIKNVGTTNDTGIIAASAFGAQVSAVRVSPNTIARVYFGSDNGRIVRVDNANSASPTFTNITTTIPQAGYISEIAVQEGDDNHIIYCISNFGTNSIWETTNGGATWTSIEGNFTIDVPVRGIMFNPNNPHQAFIGTDIGVYSTDNLDGTNTQWGETNTGLARVSVQYLEYRRGEGTLLAVTHGRGVYTSNSLESPVVYFGAQQTVTEDGTSTTGCRKYKDVQVPVVLSKNPSASVQVNVSVNNQLSTATNGQDYEILTPMPLTFTTASTQNLTVRVYDDANTENTETAALELSIVNPTGTNAKKGAAYLDYFTITDNDKAPQVGGATEVLFTENWDGGQGTWQGFNTSTGNNAWKISSTCDNVISGNTATVYNKATNSCGYDNTSASEAVIYQTINASGKANLSIEFDWKGYGEIGWDQGEVVFDTTTSSTPTWNTLSGAKELSGKNDVQHVVAAFPEAIKNRTFRFGFRWYNDDNTGQSPAFAVDNIKLTSVAPAVIQTGVNGATAPTNYVGALETVHFYDAAGNIIASLKNNNSTTLGCVKLEIDRAGGNANMPFWDNNASHYLCSKTFLVTAPDAPANGLSYDITLYYTAAEINTWKSGTGRQESEARIVKVSGHSVNEITPGTPYTSSVTVSPTVKMEQYGVGQYAFTATFTSFSGFGLGMPISGTLPITLLKFNGALEKDKAVLTWTTASEYNNKGFYLERSFDGQNFAPITFVKGQGTSTASHSYSYNDYDLNNTWLHYRLRLVDKDDHSTYSQIVKLQVGKNGSVKVFPNPFSDNIKILLGETSQKVNVQLLTIGGSKVYNKDVQLNGQSSFTLDLSNMHLPKGEYIVALTFNDKKRQVKVMKE